MNDAEQAYGMLKDFCKARARAPWTAAWFEVLAERTDAWMGPRRCVQRMGGMIGELKRDPQLFTGGISE